MALEKACNRCMTLTVTQCHQKWLNLTGLNVSSFIQINPSSPPVDNIWAIITVHRIREKIIRTVLLLYCVRQLCTHTHIWEVLEVSCCSDWGFIFVCFFMASLCNRAGHYIFALWFLLSIFYLPFFPRLISAGGNWMSTILPHMVWP